MHQSSSIKQALEKLQTHDHLCIIYETHDEWRDTLMPYLALGLEQGEKCAYLVGCHTADEIRQYLGETGIDVESVESSGQLVILNETEAYTKSGYFDPDRVIELLSQLAETTVNEGYACLRVTGEMTWVFQGHPGSERFLEYESRLSRDFFDKYPAIGLCQYDRRRADPKAIAGVVLTHPLLARGEHIYDNFYYMPADDYLSENRHEHQIENWLNNLERERKNMAEHQRIQTELLMATQEWERTFDAIPDLIAIIDARYRILRANKSMALRLGMQPEDCAGLTCHEYIHDLQKPPSFCPHTLALMDGKEHTAEVHESKLDGDFLVSVTPLLNQQGEVIGTVHVARDITERKKLESESIKHQVNLEESVAGRTKELEAANDLLKKEISERKRMEEDLRHSENQLRLITDSISSAISYLDSQKRYLFVNKAYETWFGHPREELPGKYVWDVIGEEAYHRVQAYIEAALSGETVTYELEVPYKDGGTRYTHGIFVPDIDDHGVVRGLITLVNNMTEFRSMERKIAEALEFNQTILESSTIGISTFDSSGKLVFINDAGARITGGKKELALKQNLNFNQYDAWKQTGLLDVASQVLATGISVNGQMCLQSVFEKDIWIDYRFSRFISSGEPHLLLMYEDITDRKQAEERIRNLNTDLISRADELTIINQEIASFSYSISHDLRAPLRAINGFSQIIYDKHRDKLDAEGRECIQIIRSEGNRMGKLIEGILHLSRLSRKELDREELDLSIVAEDIALELQRSEPERQVEFAIAPGIKAYGDRVLLQSVLQNLLENAWKFTSKHQKAKIEFGLTDVEGKKAYFVRDDGAGFDMKYSDRLFGTFQRLHGANEFPGNGVGLAIIQRIIHHHSGQVWAEGEAEKGATFYFTLD